jgi:hypothetical protein
MICVIVLLTVVGGILVLLLTDTLAVQRSQDESYDRLMQQSTLADEFRADVRRAEKAPYKWQKFVAGAQTLILQMKTGEHVLYLWSEGELERRVFEGKKESVRVVPVGVSRTLEFVRDGSGPELVRLRLVPVRAGKALPGQALEIAATVGGDWR